MSMRRAAKPGARGAGAEDATQHRSMLDEEEEQEDYDGDRDRWVTAMPASPVHHMGIAAGPAASA